MSEIRVRGIRGATSVTQNTPEAIWEATSQLLLKMTGENNIPVDDIVSIIFSTTGDLNAAFPAKAARDLGWQYVPLLDVQQYEAPDLPRTIRVLMHVNTPLSQQQIRHIYLGQTKQLRPDLVHFRDKE
ncbi:MAG: chorismate mutase [Clostridia bacterium]|nr:chorismate mutase [Clostridia bacterium]